MCKSQAPTQHYSRRSFWRAKARLIACTAIISCAFTLSAQAQSIIPETAEPARTGDQIQQERPDPIRETAPITVPQSPAQEAPQGAESVIFRLENITFEGAEVYDSARLKSLYVQDLGQDIPLTRIYDIAQEVTRLYRGDGYILSQAIIPQQSIENGAVVIKIIEGFIDQVYVEGAEGTLLQKRMARMAQRLTEQRPLTNEFMEQQLLLINDIAGASVRTVIAPSPTVLGAADLTIIADGKPYQASLSADNLGSRFIGPLQFSIANRFSNIMGLAEQTSLQYVTSPEDDEMHYVSAGISAPINNYGTTFSLTGTYSDTEPGFTLDEFNVDGYSRSFRARLQHPVMRSRLHNMNVSAEASLSKSITKSDIEPTRRDRIRALTLGIHYDQLDYAWNVAASSLDLQFSKGFDIIGASTKGDANLSRANGEPEFFKANLEAQRQQQLYRNFWLNTSVSAQWAAEAQLSGQEFGVGGRDFGRGYDSSEITGDDGVAAKAELTWRNPIDIDIDDVSYDVFGFYDFGKVWNQDENATLLKTNSLASAGFGVRFELPLDISGEGYMAFPLTRDVQTRNDQDPRFFFRLSKEF